MRQRGGIIGLLPIMAIVVAGCATKGYVREEADQRVGRAEGRLGQLVEQVRAMARGAYERAEAVDGRLSRLWSKRHVRTLVDTIDLRFGFDRADLDDRAQTALVDIVRELQANPHLTVDLAGYTDPIGPRDYNFTLSQRRVEAVRRFLVEQGVALPRIHSVGLGPLPDQGIPAEHKRRVTINMMVAD